MISAARAVAIHGHRGSRGTHPENILRSFEEARDAGAAFVELDVHLSRDDQAVVFHDFEISGKLCRDPGGKPPPSPIHLRELTVRQLQEYDCGSVTLPGFPDQTVVPGARIPTLEELIRWKRAHAPSLGLNIEIKLENPPTVHTPVPDRIAQVVIGLLRRHDLIEGSLVQSFNLEVVRAARRIDPGLRLSCLFENHEDFARVASAIPAQVAAPHYELIDADAITRCETLGIELLPWTVNEPAEWRRLIDLGIRSIITDYPRKLAEYLSRA